MSIRPSVISHSSHAEGRRTLPPMRNSHPKLHTLRRCTSLEWVYDAGDDSNSSVEYCKLVIREGDEYDDLHCISKDVWLDIQWYYRRVDLEDQSIDLAAFVGEYELVLSDHKSIVDMNCIEDHARIIPYDEGNLAQAQIPVEKLYHRWNISMQFVTRRDVLHLKGVNINNSQVSTYCSCNSCNLSYSSPNNLQRYCRACRKWFNETCLESVARKMNRKWKARLPSDYDAVQIDADFGPLLTMPIRRGGHCGVVGNGMILIQIKTLLDQAMALGQLPAGWKDGLHSNVVSTVHELVQRYYCPVCGRMVV
ncbi:uncharacterized protein HD556DRAFT_1307190 [Suillus plorans]|uniref:Uncharacterized protein n=1 Tax=Suillus plorans TaxID=116603 RepID=A0A9P7AVD0_9AGAM|nr:uncharacterized protein HD556DRAFT_1307190 [Suillus plorans]KAG1795964.1 hypothetical protein HD556DRAFT_1307190 [Suillus plorans]